MGKIIIIFMAGRYLMPFYKHFSTFFCLSLDPSTSFYKHSEVKQAFQLHSFVIKTCQFRLCLFVIFV